MSIFGNGGHVGASDTFTNTWSQSRQTVNQTLLPTYALRMWLMYFAFYRR